MQGKLPQGWLAQRWHELGEAGRSLAQVLAQEPGDVLHQHGGGARFNATACKALHGGGGGAKLSDPGF